MGDYQHEPPLFHRSANCKQLKNHNPSSGNKRAKTLSIIEQVLLTEGAVLQLIMDFVPCFELSNKASVCQLWKKAVSQSYCARINTPWTTLSARSKGILTLSNKKEYFGGQNQPWTEQSSRYKQLPADGEPHDDPSVLYAIHGYKQQHDKHLGRHGSVFYKNLCAMNHPVSGEKMWRLRIDRTFRSEGNGEGPRVRRFLARRYRAECPRSFFAEPWQASILQSLKLECDLPTALLNMNDTLCVYHSMNLPTGLMLLILQRQWTEEYSAYLESKGLEDSFKSWRPEDKPGVDYWGVLYHISNPFSQDHLSAELVDCKRLASNDLPILQINDFFYRSENGEVLCVQTAVASEWRASRTGRNSFDSMIYTFKLDRDHGIQSNHAAPLLWPGSRLYSYLCLSPAGDWMLLLSGYAAVFSQYNENTKAWDVMWDCKDQQQVLPEDHFHQELGDILERRAMKGFFTADGDFCVKTTISLLEFGGSIAPGKTYALSPTGKPYRIRSFD